MDIKSLLESLLDHKVRFVVIGAWALPAYGIPRMTGDIDIFIKPSILNARRTKMALESIGYDVVSDVPAELFLKKKVLIRQYILQTDIHPFVKGIDFDTVWKNKQEGHIFGVPVFVPSVDDMILMKTAAGRPKDKLDLKNLRALRRKTNL